MGLSSLSVVLYREHETPNPEAVCEWVDPERPPNPVPACRRPLGWPPPRGLRRTEGGVAQGAFFPPGRGRRTASMTPLGRSRRHRGAEARCFLPPGDPRTDPPGTARRPPTDPLHARQPTNPAEQPRAGPPPQDRRGPRPRHPPPTTCVPRSATRFHRRDPSTTPIPLAASEQPSKYAPQCSASCTNALPPQATALLRVGLDRLVERRIPRHVAPVRQRANVQQQHERRAGPAGPDQRLRDGRVSAQFPSRARGESPRRRARTPESLPPERSIPPSRRRETAAAAGGTTSPAPSRSRTA